jgi:RHS repeat-associated protein
LSLFSQKPTVVKKDCGCANGKVSIKTVYSGRFNGAKNTVLKKNFDRILYDDIGRITRIISKDMGERKFVYNEYGRLEIKIKSNMESQHYHYDKLGRNTRIEFCSNRNNDSVEFKYSTPEESYMLGNIVEKIEKNEHSYYKYSGRKLKSETKIIKGHKFVVTYDYNENGLLSKIRYPSGLVINYEYDKRNKIKNIFITRDNKEKRSVLNYVKRENTIIFQYGNGLRTEVEINTEKKSVSMKIGNDRNLEFVFNDNGFIEKVVNKKNIKDNKEFYYDQHGRLITSYGSWGKISYRYDSMDNLITKIEKGGKLELNYDTKSARIKELKKHGKSIEVEYDKLGRMAKYNDMSFTYNNRGRLEKIFKNNKLLTELCYNYKHQRVIERNENEDRYYIYDNHNRILAEYNYHGEPLKEYIYANETIIGFIRNKSIYYYHYDLMNFPIMISDDSGKVVREVQYKPYGEIIYVMGNLDDTLRYPGQFELEGTGIFYNLNRIYNPRLSRYQEPDPVVSPSNLYQYAECNPQYYVDLNGLKVWEGKNCYFLDLYSREGSISFWFVSFGFITILRGENIIGQKEIVDNGPCYCFDPEFPTGRKFKLTEGKFTGILASIGLGAKLPLSISYLDAKGLSIVWPYDYPKVKEFKGKIQAGSIVMSGINIDDAINISILTIGNVGIERNFQGSGGFLTTPDWSIKRHLIGRAWEKDPGTYKCCTKEHE